MTRIMTIKGTTIIIIIQYDIDICYFPANAFLCLWTKWLLRWQWPYGWIDGSHSSSVLLLPVSDFMDNRELRTDFVHVAGVISGGISKYNKTITMYEVFINVFIIFIMFNVTTFPKTSAIW